jgi:hypothetical protein
VASPRKSFDEHDREHMGLVEGKLAVDDEGVEALLQGPAYGWHP